MISIWVANIFIAITAVAWPHTLETVTSSVDLAESIAPTLQHPVELSTEEKPDQNEVDVKELVTASYKGLSYVMVRKLSLGFAEAERYCADELSDPMHLTSVQSENEWKMLTKVFGTSYPSEFWLGGTVQRSNSRIFLLRWLDGLPFTYHRFPITERKRWLSNWRLNSQGCTMGNLQFDGKGNWTAELTPCTEPKAFVCKETPKPVEQPMSLMLNPNMFTFRNLISTLLPPPFMAPWHFGGMPHGTQRAPMRFQIHRIPTKPQHTASPASEGETVNNLVATTTTTTERPQTTMSRSETTLPLLTTTEETNFLTTLTPTNGPPKTLQPSTENLILRNQVPPNWIPQTDSDRPTNRDNYIKRPTFSVFSSAPQSDKAKEKLTKSTYSSSANSKVPNIATQVIYPNTLWDLTYPEEPKWLTTRKVQRGPGKY